MEPALLPTEVILIHPKTSLGTLDLDRTLQPGADLDLNGQTYAILERHHRYQLISGRYRLYKVVLHVQQTHRSEEKSLIGDRWVLGNAACQFNARSELLRCAVNPIGPCELCHHYTTITP